MYLHIYTCADVYLHVAILVSGDEEGDIIVVIVLPSLSLGTYCCQINSGKKKS